MTAALTAPGYWYISFPCFLQPESLLTVGPFDTENEASDWLAGQRLLRGGFPWRESADAGQRLTVHDCGVAVDTLPIGELRRAAREAMAPDNP
jgi:hypothetical protein